MRFDEWMNMTNTPNAIFGKKIGTSGETVRRYRSGDREPDTATMKLIFEQTDGLVAPNDWAGVGPRAAAVSHGGDA